MPPLVVPYHDAMHLGQGYNSYTQSICLSRAVTGSPKSLSKATTTAKASSALSTPKTTQKTTYSARFIDNPSDLFGELNLSAASYIKAGKVGYCNADIRVDMDKISESDLNLIITVRVTNDVLHLSDEAQFNLVEGIDKTKFAEIYGDTFISGFLRGGEFVSVVSIKVRDSTKTPEIRRQLEAALSAAGVEGTPTSFHSPDVSECNIFVKTYGTSRSDGSHDLSNSVPERPQYLASASWDIDSVFRAAANFPALYEGSTEIHSAVLTPYSALPSFVKISAELHSVSYKNVGLYTSRLLRDFLDYNSHLKSLALISRNTKPYTRNEAEDAFDPAPSGLNLAERAIQQQLIKIVKDVDSICADPNVAVDAIEEDRVAYIDPRVFSTRLPTRLKPSSLPAHSENKPASALPAAPTVELEPFPSTLEATEARAPLSQTLATDNPAPPPPSVDPKTWQWVYVPGVDSYGNDIFTHGNGRATPEEIMVRINEWELENPGEIVRGFDLRGRVKRKVSHRSAILPPQPGLGLYVRVVYDDQWTFISGAICLDKTRQYAALLPRMDDTIDIIDYVKEKSAKGHMAFDSIGASSGGRHAYATDAYEGFPLLGAWVRNAT